MKQKDLKIALDAVNEALIELEKQKETLMASKKNLVDKIHRIPVDFSKYTPKDPLTLDNRHRQFAEEVADYPVEKYLTAAAIFTNRSDGNYKDRGLYLSGLYNWQVVRDDEGCQILVPVENVLEE